MVTHVSWFKTMSQHPTGIHAAANLDLTFPQSCHDPITDTPATLSKTAVHRPPRRRRAGFTLIELMAVMVIIALIASITMASVQHLIRTSRKRRYEVTCLTLETALARYRHEYNAWPVDSPSGSSYSVGGEDNKTVFGKLRDSNSAQSANPKGIRFLDETTLYTTVKNGTEDERMILSTARAKSGNANVDLPLVYRDPKSGDTRYFQVTFDFNDDTVDVR